MHAYEIRPRKDHRGVDLVSDVLPFGRLWYSGAGSRREGNRIRDVYDAADNVIETHEHKASLKSPGALLTRTRAAKMRTLTRIRSQPAGRFRKYK
jgi:hypothetical protein